MLPELEYVWFNSQIWCIDCTIQLLGEIETDVEKLKSYELVIVSSGRAKEVIYA